MTETPETPNTPEAADLPSESLAESAGRRGEDDRRSEVNPADHPAPHSPAPDQDAVRKGEENLNSIKPY